jgi:heme exporter protein A
MPGVIPSTGSGQALSEAKDQAPKRAHRGAAIEARDLAVRFGSVPALSRLTLNVANGERLAIFGPNGAGKTTLLRVLAGALRPSAGEVRLDGHDPYDAGGSAIRARVGLISHQTYLYGELTAAENLGLYGRLYDVPGLEQRVPELLHRVGLYDRRDDRVDSLSRGLQQRLAIARVVLHEPSILLLDEPETGLDLQARDLLDSVLFDPPKAGQAPTVLMATQDVDRASRLCHNAAVLVSGRLAGLYPVEEVSAGLLRELYGGPLL